MKRSPHIRRRCQHAAHTCCVSVTRAVAWRSCARLSAQTKLLRFVDTNAAQLDDLLVAVNALVITAIAALFALTFAENEARTRRCGPNKRTHAPGAPRPAPPFWLPRGGGPFVCLF